VVSGRGCVAAAGSLSPIWVGSRVCRGSVSRCNCRARRLLSSVPIALRWQDQRPNVYPSEDRFGLAVWHGDFSVRLALDKVVTDYVAGGRLA
jgi:hypothetical protein